MSARTLNSTWKTFARLARRYFGDEQPETDCVIALDELSRKANESGIVDALATLFVRNYDGMEDVEVQFVTSNGNGYPEWPTAYAEQEKTILLNPLGIFQFRRRCEQSCQTVKTPVGRESFQSYRYYAYLSELRKLPDVHLLFLQLLKEVAMARAVAQVEKKGGGVETADDESYMVLLWAFNELESFFAQNDGSSLRSRFGIYWYESEWVAGK